MSQMDSSPLNLIDDSVATDWTDEAGAAVFVLELAELTELHRIAFDTGGLNRGIKSAKEFVVEVSETSATKSFTEVLGGTLKMAKNGQSFSFKPEERPTAQWVRLTICASSHAGLARADHRFFGSTAENQRRGHSIFKKSPIAAVMGKVWVRWTICAKRSFTIIMRA